MGSGMGGLMMGWMALWGLVALALLGLSVVGAVWLIRGGRSEHASAPLEPARADEILRRRYASGEIEEDEFFRRRSGLGD